ncbi:LytR cell envelope-related transcriptional attenuator [Actinokineospora alba]|uniref:LytR cell envelope-related transcriptional attenuator n=1 Tax=Actinokineospora alba TaxID=504798 RepID=A0A1H0SPL0_9PSEU|nr:LytR C-terminal domain-containing protein [Actinokineospora alba]TDP66626.1 LytR cell envelope-related transcriptional attenuator [Actinokineospora alba]SDJ39140.1 LytR cell envelope-related transcriptional attenuator [Actinokineospora alba]SDP43188.1 LytR cell envelope-related transcriptional attenuator [Actinokineospora alba]
MTTDPSAARPGKIAGLVLIGVAAVSTVLGVVTLLGGNGDSEAGQQPQSSAPAASQPSVAPPSTSGSSPGSSSAAPTTTTTTPPVSTTAAPTSTAPGPGQGPGQPGTPSTKDQPVRIYNNSTIADLASRAQNDLKGHGWNVVETGNYSQGIIPTTTVYFVPGTAEEAAARALAAEFGIRAEPRFEGIKDSRPGLILIVTKDYRGAAGKE